LKLRFVKFNPNKTLKVYGVNERSLMAYHNPENPKYNIVNVPTEDKRLKDQEIMG
jgi:hypothetical protein